MLRKSNKKKPVTLITGYLGSGKTTLLNELLQAGDNHGIALIVNDMGSINVDARLIRNGNVMEADTKMIELQNGCICCTLRDAFMDQIESLSKDRNIKKIVVEASGISNPASIAEGFLAYEETVQHTNVYLDSIVTVVDADRIHTEFMDELRSRQDENEDDPDIINLVMDQIEFCNLIILNKCDLLRPDQIQEVKNVISCLQKEARIVEAIHGKVDADLIFHGEKFDYDRVMNSSKLQQALSREREQEECVEEYGITSFVYEERCPFDYERFMNFLENDYPESMIRAKGYIWFADDDIHVQLFEQAGRNASVTETSNWIVAFPKEEQTEVFENYPEILDNWDEKYGDRQNQIVFIGKNCNQNKILEALDSCIVRDIHKS